MATKKTTKTTAAAEVKTTVAAPVEAKVEEKAVEVKVEEKAAPAKKACAKKAAPAVKVNVTLQYAEKEYTIDSIVEKIKAVEADKTITTLDVYVVPETATVYYVVNGEQKSMAL
ncbi:MAG: DUF6465 family protein [Acutalibacteraceae bacterium]